MVMAFRCTLVRGLHISLLSTLYSLLLLSTPRTLRMMPVLRRQLREFDQAVLGGGRIDEGRYGSRRGRCAAPGL